MRRHHIQRKRYCGIDRPHSLGRGGECPRQHEYPDHIHYARVGRTGRKACYALVESRAAHYGNGINRRHEERHGDRYAIEIARNDRTGQIYDQQHDDGRQGQKSPTMIAC